MMPKRPRNPGRPWKPGERRHLASIRGTEAYDRWLDTLESKARAASKSHLIDQALACLAEQLKHRPPPDRLK